MSSLDAPNAHPAPTGHQGTGPESPKAQSPLQKILRGVGSVVLVILIVVAVRAGFRWISTNLLGNGNVEVGDCLTDGKDSSITDCDSSSATLKVYGIAEGDPSAYCSKIPGAEQTILRYSREDTHNLCVGPKNADVSASVNGATVGACVTIPPADKKHARLAPCGMPGSQKIVQVLDGNFSTTPTVLGDAPTPCAAGQDTYYFGVTLTSMNLPRALCMEPLR